VVRVALLASGGKDSALSLYRALTEGHKVAYLVTMIPLREDSWMFHFPNIQLVDLFSEAVDIPLVKSETSGIKERELEDLTQMVEKLDVEGLVSGAIASTYQKTRIEKVCQRTRLECIMPLWHEDPFSILDEILRLNFEVIITGVYAYGFDEKWLGRKIEADALTDLAELNKRYGISLVGEGGEYETLVLDAPFFKKRIRILAAEKIWENQSGYYLINKAELEKK